MSRARKSIAISGEWFEVYDEARDRNYYYNRKTSETTWTRPPCAAPKVPEAHPQPPPPVSEDPPLPPGWRELIEPKSQRKYFVNLETRQTQWHRPTADSGVKIAPTSAPVPMTPAQPAQPSQPQKVEHSLPVSVAQEIHQFQMSDFATKYFSRRQTGFIFKREVPVSEMVQYQRDPLEKPLLSVAPGLTKQAINCFKLILGFQGEKSGTKGDATMLARRLLEAGSANPPLRDEIFVQLVKQTTNNPNEESLKHGWMLMALCCSIFPPSKDFESYLSSHLSKYKYEGNRDVQALAKLALNRLLNVSISGEKGRLPSSTEINGVLELAHQPYVYSASLEDCMLSPGTNLPRVLTVLADLVIKSRGTTTQGVFRVPGDEDEMQAMKRALDSGDYTPGVYETPHTPASALKLWLRELAEPLIPNSMYKQAIDRYEDANATLGILKSLSPLNRAVIEYILQYLQSFAKPEIVAHTSMPLENLAMVFAPCILRCPSQSPAVILELNRKEQSFVLSLLTHWSSIK